MPLFDFLSFFPCHTIPIPLICTGSSSCPTLPSLFCFYLSPLTRQRDSMPRHMCSISRFALPASCLCSGGCLCREVVVVVVVVLSHHGSFCSPISTECSGGSVRLGRMLYGVEILREREMMDGNLYQSPELSTSSLPLSALMSADHGDPKATGHCALITLTHTHMHTHSRRHLGNNWGISELKRERGINGQPICYMKNSSP